MIRIQRLDIDDELGAQVAARIARLHAHLAEGTQPPDALLVAYRNPAVKSHLLAESHGKCIYCESKVTHVYFGDIEHIRPKKVFPADMLDMGNLALACAQCNNAKGDYWHQDFSILDPHVDNPDDELIAFGFYIARHPGRERAQISIAKLDLNRQALLERRKERVELLQPLVDQYSVAPPGPLKELLEGELIRQAADDGEYAMTVRAYLKAVCNIVI